MNNQEKLTPENLVFLEKDTKKYYKNTVFIVAFITFIVAGLLLWNRSEYTYKENLVIVCTGFAMILYVFFNVFRESQKLKKEIETGYKEIILDKITKKKITNGRFEITVRNVIYILTKEEYDSFEENDNVRIEITPITKTVIKISKEV